MNNFYSNTRKSASGRYAPKQKTNLLLSLAFAAIVFIGSIQTIKAQANAANYGFSASNTASLTDMSTGTTTLLAADLDDNASAVTSLGFEFYFMGVRQTQFSVNTNGTLRFGATAITNTGYDPLGQAAPQALVTSFGADQRTHAGDGKVHYKVTGAAPNRVLVIEWLNMQSNFNAGGTADLTYQLRLYETSGIIESVYGTMNMTAAAAADPNSNSPQYGFSSGNAVGTVGSLTAAQSGAPAPTFNGASATPTNNLYVAGPITVLSSVANGSRTMFTYTPPVPAAPSALSFTAVTQTGMTLNWVDNSANEVGFAIYQSTDGINYSYATQAAANATSNAVTGLFASTNYFWKVYAVTEGALSPSLDGSQMTLATSTITSNGTGGGLWSQTTTWLGGVVPTLNDVVTIKDGDAITIDIAATAYSLTVGEGATGTLEYEQTTARTLTVYTNVTIANGAVFRSNLAGTQTGHILTLQGNLTNNGTLDFSTNAETAGAGITFTGTANSTFGGSGATTDLRNLTINKGTNNSAIAEITASNFTVRGVNTDVAGGFLTLTNGTLKISGSFTYTGRTYTAAAYTIPATAGIWLNNPNYTVAGQNGSATLSGLLRVSQGTYNVGTATGNSMGFAAGSTIIIEGGAVNTAGRFGVAAAANIISFTQSGGAITVCMIGNASGTLGSFDLGTSTLSTISISGGTITCQINATAIDYRCQSGSGILALTGGTLNLGNAASGAAKTFNLRGLLPNVVVTNTSAGHTAMMSTTVVSYNNASLNITTNTGATFNTNNAIFLFTGTTLTNDGTFTATGASSNLYMFSPTATLINHTITGSGVFTAAMTNITLQTALVTITTTNQIPVNRCNVLYGGFINANKLTLGNAAATTAIVQYGVASPTQLVYGFDAAPTWNAGTGGVTLIYAQELSGRTTGFEVPPNRTVNTLNISNTNNITLSGGNLNALNTLAMGTGNVITGNDTLSLGTSAAVPGTFTYTMATGGIVVGKFKRWINATIGNTDFPVGILGSKRNASINYTTAPTVGGTLTAQWISSAGGTNGLPLTEGALSVPGTTPDGYWSVAPGDGLATDGLYTGTFTATGIAGVTDVTNLVLVERTNSASAWMLDGTHVTGTGTPAIPVVSRTGMAGFKEFAVGSIDYCPVATAAINASTTTICNGDNTTLTASGVGTYTWNTGATTASIIVAPTADSTFSVIVNNGCNTASANITVIVNQPTVSTISASGNDSISVNGTMYYANGSYIQHMTNAAGCDSAITVNVTLAFSTTSTLNLSGCDTVTVNGIDYTASGTYVQHIPNVAGADSAITINAIVTLSTTSTISVSGNDSVAVNGTYYTANGTYTQYMTNSIGCDSIITINVTIANSTFSTLNITNCDTVTVNGTDYILTGTYIQHMPNAAGADSTITINATVNHSTSSSQTISGCDSVVYNSVTYFGNATDVSTIANAAGCDSVITTTIVVQSLNLGVTYANDTLTAAQSGGTYQWLDCDNANAPIAGASNQWYAPTVPGNYAVVVDNGICSDTSACQAVVTIGIRNALAINNAISIYPNPGTGIFNVRSADKITALEVYNAIGELVYSSANGSVVNITEETSGVYILKVVTDKGITQHRIVKQY